MNAIIPSVTLVRRFKATPERVWEAWTSPEVIALWFGPHHTRVESARVDLRLGGELNVVLREENGERHETKAVFQVIEKPRRLVLDWSWITTPERVSRLTVLLRAVEEGTELTLTHDRFADEAAATGHTRGWTEALERLLAALG